MWGVEIGVMLFMILLNSVFAGFEIALASISQSRLESLAKQHKNGSASAVRMKSQMEASLAVVQLGISLVGVIAAATGGAGAEETIEPILLSLGFSETAAQLTAIGLVVAPLTFVTIIFGELLPKVFVGMITLEANVLQVCNSVLSAGLSSPFDHAKLTALSPA